MSELDDLLLAIRKQSMQAVNMIEIVKLWNLLAKAWDLGATHQQLAEASGISVRTLRARFKR